MTVPQCTTADNTTPYVLPKLTRRGDQDTVVGVSHEDGALDSCQEYLDVLTVVNSDGIAPVEQINTTIRTILYLKLLSRHCACK